jgi:molybdate transport repressor ModE-like protein
LAAKIAKAMGAAVTVFTTTEKKLEEARRIGVGPSSQPARQPLQAIAQPCHDFPQSSQRLSTSISPTTSARIDELNGSLKEPAVASAKGGERGGGSEVTAVGLRLIAQYRQIESTAAAACAAEIRALTRLLAGS